MSETRYEETNLMVNYLPPDLSDEEFAEIFKSIGPVKSTKIVREKTTGKSIGYGFVNYESLEDANLAITTLNGMPLQNKKLKVDFANKGKGESDHNNSNSSSDSKDANLYVQNIPLVVTEEEFGAFFKPYGNIVSRRLLKHTITGQHKGVGFVLFKEKHEAELSIKTYHGSKFPGYPNSDPLIVKYADNKSSTKAKTIDIKVGSTQNGNGVGPIRNIPTINRYNPYGTANTFGFGAVQAQMNTMPPGGQMSQMNPMLSANSMLPNNMMPQNSMSQNNPMSHLVQQNNASNSIMPSGLPQGFSSNPAVSNDGFILFVYNIGIEADDKLLFKLFAPFGAVLKASIVKDTDTNQPKGFGFVTMRNFAEASNAIQGLNGHIVEGATKPLQVSFKTQGKKK